MHPILVHPSRLAIYLIAWLPIAGLLAQQVAGARQTSWLQTLPFILPLVLFYAFVCLASWYPCRAMQPGKVSLAALGITHAVAAAFSAGIWFVAARFWNDVLDRIEWLGKPAVAFEEIGLLLLATGVFLYLLVAAGHYLIVTLQASQEVESRNLELQVRTQEAELRALKAQREQELAARELELARTIQQRLLPPVRLEGAGFRVAARNLPAQFVAGDFYDFFELPDGSLAVVVADVAGKGVGASLIMASVKSILPLVAADRTVTGTLSVLNAKLAEELAPREFVALCLARFQPAEGIVEIANAGLPDPYLLDGNGGHSAVIVPGPRLPLGVRDEISYESSLLTMASGERLFLLSDGLPEAADEIGEPLGYAKLESLLDHQAGSPEEWLDRLLERFESVAARGAQDDVTALVLEAR